MARYLLPLLLLSLTLIASPAPRSAAAHRASASLGLEIPYLSVVEDWAFESGQDGAQLGYAVDTAGDVNGDGYDDVIVGSPLYTRDTPDGVYKEGAAFVFYGSAEGLSASPDWVAGSAKQGSRFGGAVSAAGDLNGDGYDDIIVGAEEYKLPFDGYVGEPKSGAVFVYFGSENGLSDSPDWVAYAEAAEIYFGFSVATAGDVNGDGYADILVGAPRYQSEPAQINEGKVYLYLGSANGPGSAPDWTYECNLSYSSCGYAVNGAGDVNHDGYDDILVGAPHYDNPLTNQGAAFLFYGAETGPTPWANWMADLGQAEAWFGVSVASAGDANADGYADVIIGAWKFDPAEDQIDFGAAFVYYGSPTGLGDSYDWSAFGVEEVSGFGRSVRSAGDVNQDGFSDVIIGSYKFGQSGIDTKPDEGAVYVYLGGAFGLQTEASWMVFGNKAETEFGFSASAAGDVNGDGGEDIIVGAPTYKRDEKTVGGRAFLYLNTLAGGQPYQTFLPLIIIIVP